MHSWIRVPVGRSPRLAREHRRSGGMPRFLRAGVTGQGECRIRRGSDDRAGGAQVYENRGIDESDRVTVARLRRELRRIDGQIAHIRSEQRLFRRYDFGSEVHQIQLTGLNAEREEVLIRLARLPSATRRRGARPGSFASWLLVPPALGVLLVRSLFTRPLVAPDRSAPRRRPSHRVRPAIS